MWTSFGFQHRNAGCFCQILTWWTHYDESCFLIASKSILFDFLSGFASWKGSPSYSTVLELLSNDYSRSCLFYVFSHWLSVWLVNHPQKFDKSGKIRRVTTFFERRAKICVVCQTVFSFQKLARFVWHKRTWCIRVVWKRTWLIRAGSDNYPTYVQVTTCRTILRGSLHCTNCW